MSYCTVCKEDRTQGCFKRDCPGAPITAENQRIEQRIAALEAELAAITRVASEYQKEAGELTAELAAAQEAASVMSEELGYRLNERDEARAEAAALRADAERYRWLRSEHADKFRDEVQIWEVRHGDELDAAIDQAKEKT